MPLPVHPAQALLFIVVLGDRPRFLEKQKRINRGLPPIAQTAEQALSVLKEGNVPIACCMRCHG
ncbi:hypothetical protein PSEUDO8AS_40344 [Pseudomonas sp. 8AS]|nr:hypothetical protein PSEUDO8AS_40344 [Pseudomonas sp. 8AS]